MTDRIFGALGLALAAFYIWQANLIQLSFITDPVGPRTFPIIIGIVLGLASLVILLRPDSNPDWPKLGRLGEIAGATVLMVAYAELLPVLGFIIATAIAAGVLTWRLGTRPLSSVVTGVSISLGIFVVFRLILGLSLARGPLGL